MGTPSRAPYKKRNSDPFMSKFKPVVFMRKFHRWLGLLIGLQVVLWLAGGFVMSFFNIEEVRGEDNIQSLAPIFIATPVKFTSNDILAKINYSPKSIELGQWQQILVWRVKGAEQFDMFDAASGEQLSPFSEKTLEAVALSDFAGKGDLVSVKHITEKATEIRGRKLPLWQFQFNDDDNTRLYLSPETGEVVARRNDTWRLFDFFWMLHIMDYKDRDNFNHPLLIIAALLGVLFSLSGLYLVMRTIFFRRQSRGKTS